MDHVWHHWNTHWANAKNVDKNDDENDVVHKVLRNNDDLMDDYWCCWLDEVHGNDCNDDAVAAAVAVAAAYDDLTMG